MEYQTRDHDYGYTQLQDIVIDTHSFQTTSSDWKRLTREIALSDSLDNFRAAVSVVY